MDDYNNKFLLLRGKRLEAIRNSLGLSRRKFADLIKIHFGTLQNWETARYGGMNEDSAKRLKNALSNHCHILVTELWLLEGKGEPPIIPDLLIHQGSSLKNKDLSEQECIQQELHYFHQFNSHSVDYVIADDLMAPIFYQGDTVAGKTIKNIKGLQKNKSYILKVSTNEILVRMVTPNNEQEDHFDLIAFNNGELLITHKKISLQQCAEVNWLRRPSAIF